MPFMCCNLTCLGKVAASKPHVLHFWLSVLPVKFFAGVYDLIILINQHYISRTIIFDMKILKHSLVIVGHLHWISMKLPEIYAMGCSELECSLRFWVCESTLVRGLLFESSCTGASFDLSIDVCVSMPE